MREECVIESWSDIENTIKYLRSSLIVELKFADTQAKKKKLIEIIEMMNALLHAIKQYLELRRRELYEGD